MHVTRISVHQVELPYAGGAYTWSGGRAASITRSFIVRVDTDGGPCGYGEVCPLGSSYMAAHPGGVEPGIAALAPCLLGADPRETQRLFQRMDAALKGHAYAKSALDMACWDVLGRAAQLPLYVLLGGRQAEDVPLYRVLPLDATERTVEAMRTLREQGYKHFQVKVGVEPREDIERIGAAVAAAGPDGLVLADANTGWRVDAALQVARATRDLHYYLEQPCFTYDECLAVRRRATQPFKLDESIETLADLLRAQRDGACDAVSLKLSRHGGLTPARQLRDVCVATGLRMTIEDAWGGSICTAAALHLALSTPPGCVLNTTDLHNYCTVQVAADGPVVAAGRMTIADAPGLGVTPDPAVLGAPVAVYE
ncbi:MAG: mandelate racemase/muconate lactonizing enzyme family protein [Gammaproteobacteria bacterium]|nr:mandelate racemase/muconate lactonizing enzyme family protein [Gammaproteobacteria bacterium]